MSIDENNCPVRATMEVIGGKWKPVILYYLKTEGVCRFGELQRLIPHISKKVLTQQLRELETDGIIDRKDYAEVPPKVEYTMTDYGRTLKPILETMAAWGNARMALRQN
jgi:DNA-binding HxlR family transcriptional regulator